MCPMFGCQGPALTDLLLFFHCVGPGEHSWVVFLVSMYVHLLSHLVDPFAREGRVMDSPTMPEACHF